LSEPGALDLVSQRVLGGQTIREHVALPNGRIGRHEFCRVFANETLSVDRLSDPKLVEDREHAGEQGFTDVKSRIVVLLDDQYGVPVSHQLAGGARARRTAADHDHVEPILEQ
jgi:hypothetical protein